MRIRITFAALVVVVGSLLVGASSVQAGSFFGPCCYGSRYTANYPYRAHNSFGNGPGTACKQWHPLLRPWYRKLQAAPMTPPVTAHN